MDSSETIEDEVTFLLRLKPSLTPPIRRKFRDTDNSNVSRKWDIKIEHHNSDIESIGSHQSSPVIGRRRYSNDKPCEQEFMENRMDTDFSRNAVYTNVSPPMTRRLVSDGKSYYLNHEPPPLPPRWQPSAPPQEEDVHMYPKPHFVSLETNHRKQQNANNHYFNFHPNSAWINDGSTLAPTPAIPVTRSFNPLSMMEIQSPQQPPTPTYFSGNELLIQPSRNSITNDAIPTSGKPPFSSNSQQKSVRPPKPSPRSSIVRDFQANDSSGNYRNVTVSFLL
ncbi:hypothetical protein HHI36_011396 [Cryptolaemus montrouzieri]|uniref:Uncharacterized protein n=1 Tax=Cryptolaemus montrouzieri TaxID=559131 RepID=A0ABD2MLJ7_9CUCU